MSAEGRRREFPKGKHLRTRKTPCPGGCGTQVASEGSLCEACQDLIRLGDNVVALEKAVGLTWSSVDVGNAVEEVSHSVHFPKGWDDENAIVAALKILIVSRETVNHYYWNDVLTRARGQREAGHSGPNPRVDPLAVLPRVHGLGESHDRGDGYLLLTDAQAESLRYLLDVWGGAIDRAYLVGIREGRSALMGLASGDVKMTTFAKEDVRIARRTQRAARRAAGDNVESRNKFDEAGKKAEERDA